MLKDFTIKDALIIIAILYILFNHACGGFSGAKSDITRDTISSITTIDTFTVIKQSPPDTVEIVKYIHDIKHDTIFSTIGGTPTIESSIIHEDSLIYAEIKNYGKSISDSIKFEYRPKFPITITHFITKETETVLEEKPKIEIYGGILTGGSTNSFKFGPLVHFKSRRSIIYSAGYDLLNKEISLGITAKISFKKNK
jgi:hypothetical protein